jgi:hypothetical protein
MVAGGLIQLMSVVDFSVFIWKHFLLDAFEIVSAG